MIKYIGSKRVLVPSIVGSVRAAWGDRWRQSPPRVLDLFSGTSRVGHALKAAGCAVVANDHNAYAATLARCYVQADLTPRLTGQASRLIAELNKLSAALPSVDAHAASLTGGYVHDTFCVRSRFFHPSNGRRIDACRERIADWRTAGTLDAELESVLLVSLMEAADRVDSTTGLQMAYLKQWAPRAFKPLTLRMPDLLARPRGGACAALELDAAEAARTPEAAACDIAYVDPPYNQHSYLSNYHIWESLVRWDKPEVYGTACKRLDCRERKSPFNSRIGCREALRQVLASLATPIVIVSFSDEGFLAREDLESMLGSLGQVQTIAHDFKRYVGAQIGIHNLQGEKVGTVGRLRNTEFVYVMHRAESGLTPNPLARPRTDAA